MTLSPFILDALVLPLIQGLTEFLPVSSSGHIALVESFFGRSSQQNLQAEIWLHAGSLIALLLYFWRDIWTLIQDTFRQVFAHDKNNNGHLGLMILLATLFTVPTALLSKQVIGDLALGTDLIGITLIITAILIVVSDLWSTGTRMTLTPLLAVSLGIVQGLAVFPGISRSGLTVAFLLLLGFARMQALRISFLLALPTIAGAIVLSLTDAGVPDTTLLIGMLVSAFASWAGIVWMYHSISRHWVYFAPYCAIVGVLILVL